MDNGFYVVHIDPTWFEPVTGSSWYVLTKTPAIEAYFDANIFVNQATQIYNTPSIFHLGTINGITSGGGCAYGYFSDFNELEAQAYIEDQSYVFQVCGVTSIQLIAKGGLCYHWTPTDYLNDPYSESRLFPYLKKEVLMNISRLILNSLVMPTL